MSEVLSTGGGILVNGEISKRISWRDRTSAIFASMRANLIPRQIRRPAPKGIQVKGLRPSRFPLVNLLTEESVTAVLGRNVSLPCSFSVPVVAVYWYRHEFSGGPDDEATLIASDFMGFADPLSGFERFGIGDDYRLLINDVSLVDETTYSCVVVPQHSVDQRGYTDLRVIALANPQEPMMSSCEATEPGRCTYIIEEDEEGVTLDCNLYNARPPASLKWTIGNGSVKISANQQIREKDGLSNTSSQLWVSKNEIRETFVCVATGESVNGTSKLVATVKYSTEIDLTSRGTAWIATSLAFFVTIVGLLVIYYLRKKKKKGPAMDLEEQLLPLVPTKNGIQQLTETDILVVTHKANLDHAQLRNLFTELHIEAADVPTENEDRKTFTNDPKLQAFHVMCFWRKTNGPGATRGTLRDALHKCGYCEALGILDERWGLNSKEGILPSSAPDTLSDVKEQLIQVGLNAEHFTSMDVLQKQCKESLGEIQSHLKDIVELRHKGLHTADETMVSKLDQLMQLLTATNSDLAAEKDFSDILKTLGLDTYYPSKISLLDAMVIKKATRPHKLVDLPWTIIHKLLMIDFHARDEYLSMVNKSSEQEISDNGGEIDYGAIFRKAKDTSDGGDKVKHLNTLDVLVATFTCCDNFLKQTLAQKLFVCKLAIPFIYPLRSEGIMGMSLWALRTITVQWQTKDSVVSETSVAEKPFPMVTFVRLGRPPLSKSKLVNDIMRDESHDTFFHHDCSSGTIARRITDGLVECSWFITGGKEKEHLPVTTMILNLRGDGSLMKKQMQILQEISSVMFVMATVQDLARPPNTNTFRQILETSSEVILFLINGENKQGTQELIEELQAGFEAVGHDLLKGVPVILSSTLQGNKKNARELKTEARAKLSRVLAVCSGISIEECAQQAKKKGVKIDEYDSEACLEGKHFADNVVKHLEGKDIAECKRLLLPLQGAEWFEYCKLLKTQHRTSGILSACHADRMKQNIDLLRNKQVDICHNRLSPFIKDFISTLKKDRDVVMYFLKWMNILFDEKSRAYLPDLRREYHNVWTFFQEAKQKQKDHLQDFKSKVDLAENQLASASLGVENLFRELGQIYEAMKSSRIGQDTKAVVESLPEIAANLLLNGIPLELVDGDASSVPIAWVSAVLCKLENIIGEKRLFVIAALGIQGSGKSTLLNTMFGLQFAVSASRCTRGAYMQLIPVDEHANLPFAYVVVVDTEGLRAPELRKLKYEHDNELATLVIGLADVTMINIKGENTAEIKDILQIAVHAFLRMNQFRKHVQDYKTCIFVHQYVAAANADMMMHACQKLQEDLDDMTKEAALSQDMLDVHNFSQIISFDVQKHVWYFPDLWHGNPPMAPSNPGYSKMIDVARSNLLEQIAKRQKTFLTTSDLVVRLDDFWNGVLAEDSVFSFRNSLEVKVYCGLQSKYYTLEWEMQKEMKSRLCYAEIKLKMCESVLDLENSFEFLKSELFQVLTEKAKKIKVRLIDYLEDWNFQETFIQLKHSKLTQLSFALKQQQTESNADLLSIKEARRVEILQTQKGSKHEEYIINKVGELADKLKGNKASDAELEERFDIMWRSIVQELAGNTEDKELQIEILMENILRRKFYCHAFILKQELDHSPLSSPLEQISLENSITYSDISNKHICMKRNLWSNYKLQFGFDHDEQAAKRMTVALTNKILKEIDTYLKGLSNQEVKFQKSHATEVVQKLVSQIEAYNQEALVSNDCNFTILPAYVVKLAVHVSRHCVHVFSLMQFKYSRKHGVKAKLQDYKNTAFSLFKNMVKQSNEEVMAGDHFAHI